MLNGHSQKGYESLADDVERFLRNQGALSPDIGTVALILVERHKGAVKDFDALNTRAAQAMDEADKLLEELKSNGGPS
ncbi:hypothetical protein D3C85_924180 [compost metagenome]